MQMFAFNLDTTSSGYVPYETDLHTTLPMCSPDDSPASQLQSCVGVLAPVEPDSIEEENDILSSIEDGPLVINQHPTFLPSDENISTPMPRITRKSRRTRNAPQHLQQYHYQEAQLSSYCASSF